jgi:hypothetical protein
MSDLAKSSITSLRLALARDLHNDVFVILKTSRWIKKHIESIDPAITTLREMLIKFLDNDELIAEELLDTFCSSKNGKRSQLLTRNVKCLRELEEFLAERIKKRPEGLSSE